MNESDNMQELIDCFPEVDPAAARSLAWEIDELLQRCNDPERARPLVVSMLREKRIIPDEHPTYEAMRAVHRVATHITAMSLYRVALTTEKDSTRTRMVSQATKALRAFENGR